MGDGTYTLCPWCREAVDPGATGVRYAVELERMDSFGATQHVEGMGGFFHPGCRVPAGRREKP